MIKKVLIFCLPFFLFGCSLGTDTPAENNTDTSSEISAEDQALIDKYADPKTNAILFDDVAYDKENPEIMGYFARPNTLEKVPAVILIHEWWGLNDQIKRTADKFAEQGYYALAVDLYGGQVATTPDEAGALATAVRENTDSAFANLSAAVAYVKNLPNVDITKVASVGWCFGGGWSYEMAKNDLGTNASVMYYGRFHPDDDLEHMKSMLLGHFGEEDASIKVDDVEQFQAKLKTLNGEHEVYIYPNAGHAFANAESDNYQETSAQLAWARTFDFLEKNLGLKEISKNEYGNWYGELLVRGYPEIRKVSEAFCEENCPEYDYIFFNAQQTASPNFEQFIEDNEGNSYVSSQDGYFLGLGCVNDGTISYSNHSDTLGMKEFSLSPELSEKILSATAENPIALRLSKLELTGGMGAPTCYSHFNAMQELQQ